MKAELRGIHSPDVRDLEKYSPKEYDNFGILIQALIGPSTSIGEESFAFLVCTPKWIESEMMKDGILFGKGYLIIKEYNYKTILSAIQGLCSRTWGENWDTIADKLSRFGDWEFEDYQNK